jgi:short-subunit dehydrogenase
MKNDTFQMGRISGKAALWGALGIGAVALIKHFYHQMTRYDLDGRVVLITGGSRGLGLAMARVLAGKKAKLVLCARNKRQLENAKQELEKMGAEVMIAAVDLSNQSEVQHLVETVIDKWGQLDVLINNAGTIIVGPENVMEVNDYKNVMDINLWAALYTIKAAVPHFLKQGEGRIVNICSIGGKVAVPHLLPYNVSKFAMVGLSEGMAAELKKDNIHVTTVIPNLMRTGSPRNVQVKGDHTAEYAWFKIADSSPLLSQDAESAAKQIIRSIESGEHEVVLTQTARLMTAVQGMMPGAVTSVMQIANKYLPKSKNGSEIRTGAESESDKSNGPVAANSDKAAIAFNEL